MWIVVVLSGCYAVVATVVAVWSARVCLNPLTKPAVRIMAYKVFRSAWVTGATCVTGGGVAAVVKLRDAGFF